MARSVAPRGRAWVALVLVSFVLIAASVIWRRTAGVEQARELRSLRERRAQLEARKAQLETDIRRISSRSSIVPIVERRLDMHVPNDTQVVILTRAPRTP
jgi:membrane protein implicated in regulation of membrane protease activity